MQLKIAQPLKNPYNEKEQVLESKVMSLVGRSIGRYHILERLGQGGMAVVYKAYDTRLERDVALKVIRTENIPPSQLGKLMKRFDREAKAQAQFNHSNIVQVYDYGEFEGAPYLVMAYLPGGTLKKRTGQPMSSRQAAQLLAPIADALAYAHAHKILHRDVKPSNILITEDGKPTLTDFGIAKILETEGTALTGTGLGVGTPEYMAPEQWSGKPAPQTDIYALGVVFYELITGRKPYEADTPMAIALKQANEPLPRPSELVPGLHERVEKMLFKALALQPEDRYESMTEFLKVLEELAQETKYDVEEQDLEKTPIAVEVPTEPEPKLKPGVPDVPVSEQETSDDLISLAVAEQEQKKFPWVWIGLGLLVAVVVLIVIGGSIGLAVFGDEVTGMLGARETPTSTERSTGILTSTVSQTRAPTRTPSLTPTPKPTITSTPETSKPRKGETGTNPKDGAVIIFIPGGTYTMGANASAGIQVCETYRDECKTSWYEREEPPHDVVLSDYWFYMYEVTVSMYNMCVNAGICPARDQKGRSGNQPVAYVSWYDAQEYCQWVEMDLPTEAQWEIAARGDSNRIWPWGNDPPSPGVHANYSETIENNLSPRAVGSYPAGASYFGALDMAGNLWEWVLDYYDKSFYSSSSSNDPVNRSGGGEVVIRGGGIYIGDRGDLRVTARQPLSPTGKFGHIGFRCAGLYKP
jgi:serine/threonine protein kinase